MSQLISVLMNCYNGEKYLREAIDSVYSQSYSNWEIIFIDNCSNDNSAKIAKSYDDKLKYYKTPKNVSLGEGRRFAIEFCSRYIATLDTDDIWEPHALKSLYDGIKSGDFALCYGNQISINQNGEFINKLKSIHTGTSGDFLGKLLTQFDIPMVATIIDKDKMLSSNLNFNEKIFGSVEYSLFLPLSIDHDFISIDSYIVKYRYHNSLSTKLDNLRHKERRLILDEMLARSPEIKQKVPKELREAYARSDYYESQSLMKKGHKFKSFLILIRNSGVNYKYLFLAIISMFPSVLWRKFQKYKYNN